MAEYKYLIVGQGLAGTILSYKLQLKGIKHMVLDDGHRSAATLAAAGLINPITGRRYVKSWMIDELLPVALKTYRGLEKLLDIKLVQESSIVRTFDNQTQENHWNESTSRPGYDNYASKGDNPYEDSTHPPYGYGLINKACQVQVGKMILAYQEYLKGKGWLLTERFRYDELPYEAMPTLSGRTFENIIFCEGYKVLENPLFNNLPFQPAKGESLIIETDRTLPEAMLRDTVFIAPLSSHTFWSGGGYVWDNLDELPTKAFLDQWMDKLKAIWKGQLTLMTHRAGVRPSVKGRRPLIGRHPLYSNMILFNGMGTKGTSLAPYWAEHLINHLEGGKILSEEINLTRFLTKQ